MQYRCKCLHRQPAKVSIWTKHLLVTITLWSRCFLSLARSKWRLPLIVTRSYLCMTSRGRQKRLTERRRNWVQASCLLRFKIRISKECCIQRQRTSQRLAIKLWCLQAWKNLNSRVLAKNMPILMPRKFRLKQRFLPDTIVNMTSIESIVLL